MAEVDSPPCCVPPIDEAQVVARAFNQVSHQIRLRILHALSAEERSVAEIAGALGESPRALARHVDILVTERLIRRRNVGLGRVYALTESGRRLRHAYAAYVSTTSSGETGERLPEPKRRLENRPPAPSPHLLNAAALLNHAAHPLRLAILLALSEGEKNRQALACEFGDTCVDRVSSQVSVLREGTLVFSHHRGQHHYFALSEAGLSLVHVVRSTCSRLVVRHGGLTLIREPVTPGDNAFDPTSSDGLACLLRTFATPERLRVLNLLATAGNVCLCHLLDVLGLPRSQVHLLLRYPKANRLVIEEKGARWPSYRLARPAVDLYWSLIGCFGPRLADVEVFQGDCDRLAKLAPCTMPIERNEAQEGKQLGRTSWTA